MHLRRVMILRIKILSLLVSILLVFQLSSSKAQHIDAQKVANYIYASGVLHPEIVLRQSIYETGWFKSKHTIQKNNIFGFRHTKHYMKFDSWQACVDYYVNWQKRKYTNTKEDYYKFLVRIRYAQSEVYIQQLKKVKLSSLSLPKNEK